MKTWFRYDEDSRVAGGFGLKLGLCALIPFIGGLPLLVYVIVLKVKKLDLSKDVINGGITCLVISGFYLLIPFMVGIDGMDLTVILASMSPFLTNLIMGIIVTVMYNVAKRSYKACDRVFQLIQIDHITNISRIAEILGVSRAKVISLANLLVRQNKINAVVDDMRNEIVIKNSIWAKQICICNNCGAEITVNLGATLTCEFCGGALSVKKVNR